jgi:hypothetical protein
MQTTQADNHPTMVGSPKIVTWDRTNKKETDEAKSLYVEARKTGKLIRKETGEEIKFWDEIEDTFIIDHFRKEGEIFMRIYDDSGDRRLVWDSKDPSQVVEAATIFNDYLSRGWRALAVAQDGTLGKRIRKFDPNTEEVFFDESNVAVKLKDFAKQFRTIEMQPKTKPG